MAQAPNANCIKEFASVNKSQVYKQQGQFFLNAFWKEFGKQAEEVWEVALQFQKLDPKAEKGNALNEVESARLLEVRAQTLTVLERRAALKEIDIDTDNKMSLLEYLLWRYKMKVDDLMSRPQGVSKELEEAEAKLDTLKERITTIQKYKGKWEGKDVPTEGTKRIAYDQDMKQLGEAEAYLDQALDFARRKLKAAEKSSNVLAQGKLWWVQRELEEAAKYAPPKKQKKELTTK